MNLEIKSYPFEVKADTKEDGVFEGYASVFGNVDGVGDIMVKGAFTKTLQESKRVKILFNHNPMMPIGKPLEMYEDSKGLHVRGKISPTEKGKETLILMKDGVMDEMSIGYQTIKDDWDKQKNARLLKEVRLWEFSPVTFAANPDAGITSVKSAAGMEQLLFNLTAELKAGKMLSSKNENLVKSAVEALTALLEANAGGEPDNKKSTHLEQEAEIKAVAADIANYIKELKRGL